MRPSNHFEEITETEFNQRENGKNLYKIELQRQMDEARFRKENDKKIKFQQELEDEMKIKAQLS